MSRILLVDDNGDVRRSIRALLADAIGSATVGEAGDAAQALDALARDPWDVALLDLSLPDRSGLDTLREIKRRWPALPVVVMSFHSEAEYAAVTRAAGAAGYVSKGSPSEIIAAATEMTPAAARSGDYGRRPMRGVLCVYSRCRGI
jgi:two-component system invasion response regulator UvrY